MSHVGHQLRQCTGRRRAPLSAKNLLSHGRDGSIRSAPKGKGRAGLAGLGASVRCHNGGTDGARGVRGRPAERQSVANLHRRPGELVRLELRPGYRRGRVGVGSPQPDGDGISPASARRRRRCPCPARARRSPGVGAGGGVHGGGGARRARRRRARRRRARHRRACRRATRRPSPSRRAGETRARSRRGVGHLEATAP